MTYKKLELRINREINLNTIYNVYRKFRKEFESDLKNKKCRYLHYSHYGPFYGNDTDPALIKVKLDFLLEGSDLEQKGLAIANELKKENHIFDYKDQWENGSQHEWLMLAHHLASECIYLLLDNRKYSTSIENEPHRNQEIKNSFGPSFTKLFFNKLAQVDIPIHNSLLSYYEDNQRKSIFSDFLQNCVKIIKEISNEKITYFADDSKIYQPKDWDFRMRFLHFIPLCSLTDSKIPVQVGNNVMEIDHLFYQLIKALNIDINSSEIEVGKEIAHRISASTIT